MKSIQSLVVATVIAIGMAAPVSAATTDPEVIIYRFPGVRDNGGAAGQGTATVFHCTNFSGANELLRFVTRDGAAILLNNQPLIIQHLATLTVSTHATATYAAVSVNTGPVAQGTTAIAATSVNIICTAETIDASKTFPDGVARRGIRFSPVPGSQE